MHTFLPCDALGILTSLWSSEQAAPLTVKVRSVPTKATAVWGASRPALTMYLPLCHVPRVLPRHVPPLQALVECWASRASVRQRRGRAGRVSPGHCLRLFSRHTHDVVMDAHQQPEILRVPLEGLVLQVGLWVSRSASRRDPWSRPSCRAWGETFRP